MDEELCSSDSAMKYRLSLLQGSVCAMTESILRAHGLKTGFYS